MEEIKLLYSDYMNFKSDISLREKGIRVVTRDDPEYPQRLRGIKDEPYGFFLLGNLPDPDAPSVAIVGARRATSHGKWFAEKLSSDLAMAGVSVISGMAEGIDGASHVGALNAKGSGKTLAVLGNGVDICFPQVNLPLYRNLSKNGGIISEYAPGTPGIAYHFPERNRIISALSDVVIVVEAREKSGSLITVCRALDQGRDVMAVPGRPDDPYSVSCNRLIREGAGICTCADDVINYMQWNLFKKPKGAGASAGEKPLGNLSPDEKLIVSVLSGMPKHIDDISRETGLEIIKLLTLLTELSLSEIITPVTNSMYRLN